MNKPQCASSGSLHSTSLASQSLHICFFSLSGALAENELESKFVLSRKEPTFLGLLTAARTEKERQKVNMAHGCDS